VEIATGTGIHGGDELESGGILGAVESAAEDDAVSFERLAEGFEGLAVEFGKLVEKEDTVVGERDLAGLGDGAAADEGCG